MEVTEPSAKCLARPSYKQTEVGVIPEDWTARPLGSFCEISAGRDLVKEDFAPTSDHNHEFPIYSNALTNAGLYGYSKFFQYGPDKITVTARGDVGHAVYRETPFCAIGRLLVLSSTHPCDLRFVTEFINQFVDFALESTGVPQLTAPQILKYAVALPPTKAEQEAIAEVLSDADALIEALEQLLTKKRQVKQGAMQELLTGKKRLPGHKGAWRVKRLGELAIIQRGASPRPIDSPVWFDEKSLVGWVRISDVTKAGMYLTETTQRLSALGVQHSRPVSRGSLIMSICATVGRPIITAINACIHDGFVVFDSLRVNKQFLYYTLSSIEGDWSRHGQTGSQMNLNTALINSSEVRFPESAEEQTAVAAILSDMAAEIALVEAKLAKARALKQGMMQELLTGKIRLV